MAKRPGHFYHIANVARVLGGCLLGLVFCSTARADYKDDIGYTYLTNNYPNVPNGSLATVLQVEAPEISGTSTNYLPQTNLVQFAGKNFDARSGPSGNSGHATEVGWRFYGIDTNGVPSSITQGITNIVNYEVNDWLDNALRIGSALGPASFSGIRVINESWAGAFNDTPGGTNAALQTLRRTDAIVDRDGVITTVGVANGSGGIPQLLGNAYNVLAVGLSSGASSTGPSTFDTPGRAKPDIVAPATATSYATPIVGAAAVLLSDSAIQQGKTNATRPVVVKSLLMTGTEKLAGWHKGTASTSDDNSVPLDYNQGAGQLRIDRSYQILQTSEATVGGNAGSVGWDSGTISQGVTNFYYLTLGQGEFSASAVWNRHVTSFNTSQDTVQLNNLDFYLYNYTNLGLGSLVDFSTSTVDNVEYLYETNLLAGTYALGVVGTSVLTTEQYGTSWFSLAAAVPEPSLLLNVLGIALLLRVFGISRRNIDS
jgi:hypothetical protein